MLCELYSHFYLVNTDIRRDFHTVILPVFKYTECKEIHLTLLNWIFCEINMIKLLAYTLLLCFLLSFKKILPSWTTAPGHIWGQCRSDCCDNAAKVLRHNRCGLSDAVRLLVHVLKPHPTSPLISAYKLHLVLCCTPVTPAWLRVPRIPCKPVYLSLWQQHVSCFSFIPLKLNLVRYKSWKTCNAELVSGVFIRSKE